MRTLYVRFVNVSKGKKDVQNIQAILISGIDDDLFSTTTVITMEKLSTNDEVYIQMEKDLNSGKSSILSFEVKPAIHFVGQRIGD